MCGYGVLGTASSAVTAHVCGYGERRAARYSLISSYCVMFGGFVMSMTSRIVRAPDRIAVSGAICGAEDPAESARALRAKLSAFPSP